MGFRCRAYVRNAEYYRDASGRRATAPMTVGRTGGMPTVSQRYGGAMRTRASFRFVATILILALAGLPRRASAVDPWVVVFRDDFDRPTLDPSAWVVEQDNGMFEISGGVLRLRSIPSGLPQIASRPGLFPTEQELRIRVGFLFGNTTCFGSAIAAQVRGVQLPGCGPDPPEVPYYGFHRDCARGTSVCAHPVTVGSGPCGVSTWCSIFESGAPTYHIGEMVFISGSVTTVIDGLHVYESTGPWPIPNTLWFGSVGDPCCNYTELGVDFVEVSVLGGLVPTNKSSWGRVKAIYR